MIAINRTVLSVSALLAAAATASAWPLIPHTGRCGPVSTTPGTGLCADVYKADVHTIADALTIINNNQPFGDFDTKTIDYPVSGNTVTTTSTFAQFLDNNATNVSASLLDANTKASGFAIKFHGYINITQTGDYYFNVGSNDGFRLVVGGLTLGSTNDRAYANTLMDCRFDLTGMYSIELDYYANTSSSSGVQLGWNVGGASTAITVIPQSKLFCECIPTPGSASLVGMGILAGARRQRRA